MKKGLTLIEVILSITLISIIAIYFLPGITFGYKHLIDSKKFTKDIFNAQEELEQIMEDKRKETPIGDNTDRVVFGMEIKGHNIKIPVANYGEFNVFQPKKELLYSEPEIVQNINSGIANVVVRLSAFNKNTEIPVPKTVSMYIEDNNLEIPKLNEDLNFLVDKKYYKIDNTKIFLVNVYRWYTSSMVSYSDNFKMDNYFIIKEWNAARPVINYEESKSKMTIPNIKDDPDYNRLTFGEIKDGLKLNDTELINQFGNRYYYHSITPFAISGKIGIEKFSNPIYINAPKIEIEKAIFGPNDNQFSIYFKDQIKDVFSEDRIILSNMLGKPKMITRDNNNDKVMIFEFENALNQNLIIEDNILQLGSVQSFKYGSIYIWVNEKPNGEFVIKND